MNTLMSTIKAFRIEHKDSKLGPFHHKDPDGVSQRVFGWGLKYDGAVFKDIDFSRKIIEAYARGEITGFTQLTPVLCAVRNPIQCHEHKFVIKVITLNKDKCATVFDQVVFSRENIIEEKEYSFLDFDDFVMEHIKQAYDTEV